MKVQKIPLHKKLFLGAAIAGSGYGSYKLFKHTDKGAERMRIPLINPITPLLLMAADDRNTELKKMGIAAIPGAVAGGIGASTLFKRHYNKAADKTATDVAKQVVDMKDELKNTPFYKFGKRSAIKSEIDNTLRAGRNTVAKHLQAGRKAGLKGAAIGGLVGGVMGAGLYAGRKDIKDKINRVYNKTVAPKDRPNLVKSSEIYNYGRIKVMTSNNVTSSQAQESVRRVNNILAGMTIKQATPIFKKIVAKKKAAGASTSAAQKVALKVLHRIDK